MKEITLDQLIKIIYQEFQKIPDHRQKKHIKLADILMSALAMFSLKDPSLLAFDQRRTQKGNNLQNIFKIKKIPSDSTMRVILDEINPEDLYNIFQKILKVIENRPEFQQMKFIENCYLVSNDGTGYFSSEKIHCANCMEKKRTKTGKTEYYHQVEGSCIIHPDSKEVFPLPPEPICRQDGDNKNDCERNASKRLLQKLHQNYSHLKFIIVEDALACNAPHIKEIQKYGYKFIIGIKDNANKFIFNFINKPENKNNFKNIEKIDQEGTKHIFNFINNVPLNASNQDIKVNFIEYTEIKKNGKKQYFTWITDLEITEDNIFLIMKGGRARWKIENETFNTLKNQGYNFEHNFGHGNKNLSTILMLLMMLAFLIDQIVQKFSKVFQQAWKKCGSKRAL